jgi:hypothetical protein
VKETPVAENPDPVRSVKGAWSAFRMDCLTAGPYQQVAVLVDFVAEVAKEDPSIAKKFKDYLREIVDKEGGFNV